MSKTPLAWKKGFIEGFMKHSNGEYSELDAQHAANAYWEDEFDDGQQETISNLSADIQQGKGSISGKTEVEKWLEED